MKCPNLVPLLSSRTIHSVGSRCNGGKTQETRKQSMAKIAGSLKQKKLKKQRNNQNSVRTRCLALRNNNAKTVSRDRSAWRGASATSPRQCLLSTRLYPVEGKHEMSPESTSCHGSDSYSDRVKCTSPAASRFGAFPLLACPTNAVLH